MRQSRFIASSHGLLCCGAWIASLMVTGMAPRAGADEPKVAGPTLFPGSTDLPDAEELEAIGARIGRIQIVVDDVFESRAGQAWNPLYRLANRLHASTNESTVAPQLLFAPGDPFARRALDETARILRSRRYFNDASVTPIAIHADNTVDVEVRAHDVWTLTPGISFGRSGGRNRSSVELKDTNFMGWGKTIAVERASNVDRSSWLVNYNDPNLLKSWWHLGVDYADSSDGYLHSVVLDRPFYSLQTPWSLGVTAFEGLSVIGRYDRGEIVDEFEADHGLLDIQGGVLVASPEGWAKRYLGGLHHERNRFAATEEALAGALPDNRLLTYPWVGVEWLEDNFRTLSNLDQIGRTEDLHLGRSLRLSAGIADSVFGADRTALVLGLKAGAGRDFGNERFLLGTLTWNGRMEHGKLRNSRLGTEASVYLRQSSRRVFYTGLSGQFGTQLDRDSQVLLGGDSGLRGYPLRYQAGSSRTLLTLEERFYSNWRPFQLFQVGGAVFFDAGRVWGTDPIAAPSRGLLKDVGIGLRLGSLRSGLGNVIHIDLAAPLDREADMDPVQLQIETRHSF